MNPKVIAFYLPQYHPTPHNDEWWGKGFTEWTNVAKAKPLFKGHYQPKIPADLGFYDLRLPNIREQQAHLAKEAGIYGFCYYHYWFENGFEELDLPFKEVISSSKPDMPFCLCWANESWYKKLWNKDTSMKEGSMILAEQKYLGAEDNEIHFNSLIQSFKDPRYIKINGKPLFMIYKPLSFIGIKEFIIQWNNLAKENGLGGFHFVGYSLFPDNEYDKIKELGFNAVCSCRLDRNVKHDFGWAIRKAISILFNTPRRTKYSKIIRALVTKTEEREDVYPTMIPNWDHTARSGVNGDLFVGSTPELFQNHAEDVLSRLQDKSESNQIAFLKSWNEWGEGNYMEPDLKFGKGYIRALKRAIEKYK